MALPGRTVVFPSSLVMLRSADGITVVGSFAVLLLELGSGVVLVTVAVLVTLAAVFAPTLTVKVIAELAPEASPLVLVQVTVCPEAVQLQPVPVPDTKLMPVGRVSVTVMGAAAVGPALLTVRL